MVFGGKFPICALNNFQNKLIQSKSIIEVTVSIDEFFKLGHHPVSDLNLCVSLSRKQQMLERSPPFGNHQSWLKTI